MSVSSTKQFKLEFSIKSFRNYVNYNIRVYETQRTERHSRSAAKIAFDNLIIIQRDSVYVYTLEHKCTLSSAVGRRLTLVHMTHLHLRSRYRYATNRLVEGRKNYLPSLSKFFSLVPHMRPEFQYSF